MPTTKKRAAPEDPRLQVREVRKFLYGDGFTVEFIPVKDAPGFSHRVAVCGRLVKSWLSNESRPNRKTALFFRGKHEAEFPEYAGRLHNS